MSIVDAISREDRVEVKFSDFYALMKEAAKAELMMNGVKTGVHHFDMYAMITGEDHPDRAEYEKHMEEHAISAKELLDTLFGGEDDEPCEGCDEAECHCAECDGTPAEGVPENTVHHQGDACTNCQCDGDACDIPQTPYGGDTAEG